MKFFRHILSMMIAIIGAAMMTSRAWTDESLTRNVTPGTHLPATFSSAGSSPIWSLTAIPRDPPPATKEYRHISVAVNSLRWAIENAGGACSEEAVFKCNTATEPVELQFQDRIFSGVLEMCPASSTGSGGGAVDNTWDITAATDGDYFVFPETKAICVHGTAAFQAQNGAGTPINSTWQSLPKSGGTPTPLPDGQTVTVAMTVPDIYEIRGTSKTDPTLSDAGELVVIKVEIKDSNGIGQPKDKICITAWDFEYKAVIIPWTAGTCTYAWSGGSPVLYLYPILTRQRVSAQADDDKTGSANIDVVVTVAGATCQDQLAVTVIKPTGETTTKDGWDPAQETDARFMMQIEPADACYSRVSVKEYDTGLTDTCWMPGSPYAKRTHTNGSVWFVNDSGGYGPDLVSWSPDEINYYRAAGRIGGVSGIQIMKIVRPTPLDDYEYERHFIEAKFDLLTITSTRDGETLTKNY